MDEIEILGALQRLADDLRRRGHLNGSAEITFLSRSAVRCWLFPNEGAEFFDAETVAEVVALAQAWIQAQPGIDEFAATIGITPDGGLLGEAA